MKSIQEVLFDECLNLSKENQYSIINTKWGAPSTTFTLGVFSLPHLKNEFKICGFNCAIRPTDYDEGLHLPAFGQFYLASNTKDLCVNNFITRCQKYINTLITKISSELNLGLSDIILKFSPYQWEADSTGYRGQAYEVNIEALKIFGKNIHLGEIEIAQVNHFSISGQVEGKMSELIVFGIDRIIAVISLSQKIYSNSSIKNISLKELYPLSAYQESCNFAYEPDILSKSIDDLRLTSTRPAFAYQRLINQIKKIEHISIHSKTEPNRFINLLAAWSRQLELDYANKVIAGETRRAFTHRVRPLFHKLANEITNDSNIAESQIFGVYKSQKKYPGMNFLNNHRNHSIKTIISEKNLNRVAPLIEDSETTASQIIKNGMLNKLWQFDSSLSTKQINNSILVDGNILSVWQKMLDDAANSFPLHNSEIICIKSALSAIACSESSLTIRTNHEYQPILAKRIDTNSKKLSLKSYALIDLVELKEIDDRVELAVIFLNHLSRSIRAIIYYDRVAQGNSSDPLHSRQTRNVSLRAGIKLGLNDYQIINFINYFTNKTISNLLLKSINNNFSKRLNFERKQIENASNEFTKININQASDCGL